MLYLVAALVYIADQLLKWLVRSQMALDQSITVWPSVLDITYIRNPGAAWGILDHARWLLVLIALLVSTGVIWFHRKRKPAMWTTLGLAFILGGALGNLTDRIVSSTVTDYVYFRIINFPVFNLADVCIDIGVVILLWQSFAAGKTETASTEDVKK